MIHATGLTRRILLAAGCAALLASRARAQSPTRHRIALLSGASHLAFEDSARAFREGLRALGYAEDNLEIEERYADGRLERLPDLARELVARAPEVIMAGSPSIVAALKQATTTIPIVMVAVGDPVGLGFVASLAHPGGNITGLSTVSEDLAAKWVELLKTVLPSAKRIAFLLNPANPAYSVVLRGAQEAGQSLQITVLPVFARSPEEIDGAFAAITRERADALIGWSDPVLGLERNRIVQFAANYKLPAIYQFSYFVSAGGLMSYGPDLTDLNRRAAAYVDKIFKGVSPADLPVEQPTKYRLVLNVKTAQALGLTIPQSILARADEVIE